MKILVTGHLGYIGWHVMHLLKEQGVEAVGCDIRYYEEATIAPHVDIKSSLLHDFSYIRYGQLEGIDCIIHLAALSNDPSGKLFPELTRKINYYETVAFARKAKDAGVKMFLFSSSCSVYGKTEDLVNEKSPLDPLTEYARCKVDAEDKLIGMSTSKFKVICLRNATAYGWSGCYRTDLVVNNFHSSLKEKGKITINSNGSPIRPIVHCRDIANAFVMLATTAVDLKSDIYNFGENYMNFTVEGIAEFICKDLTQIEYLRLESDSRSYEVDFTNFGYVFPFFKFTLFTDGLQEMNLRLKDIDLSSSRFIRLETLKKLFNK